VLRRKHLSRTPDAKNRLYLDRSWPREYGEKPALPLTMTLIAQHFFRHVCALAIP
jgi:hypothetical protein